MLVKVTGGISREDGGLKLAEDVALLVVRPVRMIGGWRSVEMATWALTRQSSSN